VVVGLRCLWKYFHKDPLESFVAGSFPALQFNPSQKPFVAFGIVPVAGDDQM
jgi:hypothetical protein